MNLFEQAQFGRMLVALVLLGIWVVCYVLGGSDGHAKLERRFVGGLTFAMGCVILAWHAQVASPWMLSALVAYPAALSMGYGAVATSDKLRRRLVYGLLLGAASGTILLPMGLWMIWIVQVLLAMLGSVALGVANPTSRVGEEGAISLVAVCLVPFMLVR